MLAFPRLALYLFSIRAMPGKKDVDLLSDLLPGEVYAGRERGKSAAPVDCKQSPSHILVNPSGGNISMQSEHTRVAQNILSHICYATLATATKTGIPWSCPVYVAFDKNFNFYWLSSRQTRHSQNIRENGQIAFVVYDSTVPEGTGKAVYIEATACELTQEEEIAYGLDHIFERAGENPPPVNEAWGDSPLRVYQAKAHAAWINVGDSVNGKYVDTRVAVALSNP